MRLTALWFAQRLLGCHTPCSVIEPCAFHAIGAMSDRYNSRYDSQIMSGGTYSLIFSSDINAPQHLLVARNDPVLAEPSKVQERITDHTRKCNPTFPSHVQLLPLLSVAELMYSSFLITKTLAPFQLEPLYQTRARHRMWRPAGLGHHREVCDKASRTYRCGSHSTTPRKKGQ